MIPLLCLVVRVTGGDLDHAPVRHDHGLEEQKLHFDLVPGMERIRSGLAVPAPGRAPPLGSDGQQAGGHADRPQIPKFA